MTKYDKIQKYKIGTTVSLRHVTTDSSFPVFFMSIIFVYIANKITLIMLVAILQFLFLLLIINFITHPIL